MSPERDGVEPPAPELLPEGLVGRLVALAEQLDAIPASTPLSGFTDTAFDALARAVFEHQFHSCPIYQSFCRSRGVTPETWPGWEGVPRVPTRAFREFDFISGDPGRVACAGGDEGAGHGQGEETDPGGTVGRGHRNSAWGSKRRTTW